MSNVRVLQLGTEDWRKKYAFPAGVSVTYVPRLTGPLPKPFDIVFLDRSLAENEYGILQRGVLAHTLFVTEKVPLEGWTKLLFDCKCGQILPESGIQQFLTEELRFYFPNSYGEKFRHRNLSVAEHFAGSIRWEGDYALILQGDFGDRLQQAAYWRNNIPLFAHQRLDLWLEYQKDPEVSVTLEITEFLSGNLSTVMNHWEFSEEELEEVVHIEGGEKDGSIFVSLRARGSGTLRVIALHDRYSRGNHGYFVPGGERYVTSKREEIFAYFDPGDRKPPLNVFFSGYKTREGFEGKNMMQKMGCPFLLIAEARLEGGCYYVGEEAYEKLLVSIIREHMEELGFSSQQVIMSGISMGSCGALYYGCDIRPHAEIVGKPLVNLGNIAANERLLRPGGFPTSLDALRYLAGEEGSRGVSDLNRKFWRKFDGADWNHTKFIVSYMLEDDYDPEAYATLLEHLQTGGVQVYGRGIHGRHNDNTSAIVQWFSYQYRKVLQEDFDRKELG